MKEARASIDHMEKELSILKREKEDYALMSEDNFRKSEQRLRDKEEECECMWYRLETMQSYQYDRFTQQKMSKVAGDHPHNEDDHRPVKEDTFSDGCKDCHSTCVKTTIDPPEYSQVALVNDGVIGPSNTSTPMVKHLGGNVNPDSTFEKIPLDITE